MLTGVAEDRNGWERTGPSRRASGRGREVIVTFQRFIRWYWCLICFASRSLIDLIEETGFSLHVFTWISIIFTQVCIVCILFVFIQYINICTVPIYVELVSLKSFLTTLISLISFSARLIWSISNSLNSVDEPLSNKQTNKQIHTDLQCF